MTFYLLWLVWLQSEIVTPNLCDQSGPPELLFAFDLFLKSYWATCAMVRAVRGDCKASTFFSEPREGGIGSYLWLSWQAGSKKSASDWLMWFELHSWKVLLYSDDGLWKEHVLFMCTHVARAVALGEMRFCVPFYIQNLLSCQVPY